MNDNKSNIPEVTLECGFEPCDCCDCDTVTIPRSEYDALIAAKMANDLILAASDKTGYGGADIIKGLFKLDNYRRALTESEDRIASMTRENEEHVGKLLAEISSLTDKLNALLAKRADNTPEDKPDA